MANFNLNVQVLPFFGSVKTPLTADADSASFGCNGYDNLAIEVSGAGSGTFAVQGCINVLDADGLILDDAHLSWTNLYVINASTFTQQGTITANGIYYIAVAGISRVRISATSVSGNNTIVGVLTK